MRTRDKVAVPVVPGGALSPELLQLAAVSVAAEDGDGEKRKDEEEEDEKSDQEATARCNHNKG